MMTMAKRFRPFLMALAAVLASSAVRAEHGSMDGLRDQRDCEIILGADGSRLPRAVEEAGAPFARREKGRG
jgi:hypothetical protein